MTEATAADYGWIRSASAPLPYAFDVGYSLTAVRGVPPEQLLAAARAEVRGSCRGGRELLEEHFEFLDEYGYDAEFSMVGVCTVPGEGGEWTLVLEFCGDLGTRAAFMTAASAGTRAVSHYRNGGKPIDFFHWYENGELRTTFETPRFRDGSTPDALNGPMSEVGLRLEGEDDPGVDRKAAVFALTERLTGVRLTEQLLAHAEYLVATVPEGR
ncbi:DUF6461 domain-containing protein [Kitasatospora cinereorecta]|uniref:DUF6461 domain-containing protein n=1 Tax=Kitasatospora cinereorecta TaxID=285560 RepID=A0ABW0V6G0_9ACTN